MTQKKKLEKPSQLLSLYGKRLTEGLEERLSPFSFEINFSNRSPRIIHISGYVLFREAWILEFDEILTQESNEVIKTKYRYHVMDKDKNLILRYDNVPHFPNLSSHPHHKHTKTEVEASEAPDLIDVIDEIERLQVIGFK